jgi:hypothetical protein
LNFKHLICSLGISRGLPYRSTRVKAVEICQYILKKAEWERASQLHGKKLYKKAMHLEFELFLNCPETSPQG